LISTLVTIVVVIWVVALLLWFAGVVLEWIFAVTRKK
jgi:hypothetical protein